MWYNGIQHPTLPTSIISIIVWKDYNCQAWSFIGNGITESSGFTPNQKYQIVTQLQAISKDKILNDIWGTAYGLVTALESNSYFSNGDYSIIMAQNSNIEIYGYVCRVENGFYFTKTDLGHPIVQTDNLGTFYLF